MFFEKQRTSLLFRTQICNLQQITVEAFPSYHIWTYSKITKGKIEPKLFLTSVG